MKNKNHLLSENLPLDLAGVRILFHNLWMLLTEEWHVGGASASQSLYSP